MSSSLRVSRRSSSRWNWALSARYETLPRRWSISIACSRISSKIMTAPPHRTSHLHDSRADTGDTASPSSSWPPDGVAVGCPGCFVELLVTAHKAAFSGRGEKTVWAILRRQDEEGVKDMEAVSMRLPCERGVPESSLTRSPEAHKMPVWALPYLHTPIAPSQAYADNGSFGGNAAISTCLNLKD